jgi:hypothetical protein
MAANRSVEGVAAPPDDSLAPGLDSDGAEPLHRGGEVLEEGRAVVGVALDEDPGGRVLPERGVGGEQAQPAGQVLVVGLVEVPRRDHVVEDGDGGVRLVPRAGPPQRARELRVQARVVPVAAAEAVQPPGELGAVGEAHGVGPRERHHLPRRDALGREQLGHGARRHVGAGEVALHVARVGAGGVAAAQRDGEPRPAEDCDEVARRQREHVGAGDHARAGRLERRLGAVHGVEGVPREGEVDLRGALRGGTGGGGERGNEDGGVAAVHEAVVEEEAQRARRRGRVRALLGRDDVRHDALRARAAVAVVVGRQPGRGSLCGGGEEEEEEGCEGEDVAAAHQRAHGWGRCTVACLPWE